MSGYPQSAAHLAYQSAANYGRVAAATPHGLIALLLDGAVERIARARGCIENKGYTEKAALLHRAVAIIDELRSNLDLKSGGELASNWSELYDYMCRQLLKATVDNDVVVLDEVLGLLNQIRSAWLEVPKRLANAGK
jgi:flagellar protein FliS